MTKKQAKLARARELIAAAKAAGCTITAKNGTAVFEPPPPAGLLYDIGLHSKEITQLITSP